MAAKINDVSIIIAANNALTYSKNCLQSIMDYTPNGYELILVNNGFTDGTQEFFDQIPGARVIYNDMNRGFAGGFNQGIKAASKPFLVLLNNDCIVSQNWLSNMLGCMEREPGIGIVGPRANRVSGRQRLEREFRDIADLHAFTTAFNQTDSSRCFPVSILSGFHNLLGREVVEEIGYLEEATRSSISTDTDYCMRARLSGYKLFCAGDVFIYHLPNPERQKECHI